MGQFPNGTERPDYRIDPLAGASRETDAKKLSIEAGLGETAIGDIIRERSLNPRHATLLKIANALDCTVEALFTGPDEDQLAIDVRIGQARQPGLRIVVVPSW